MMDRELAILREALVSLNQAESEVEVFDYPKLAGPCVYLYYGKENVLLYIGSSSRGMSRAFTRRTGNSYEPLVIPPDSIKRVALVWCSVIEEALYIEAALIRQLHPLLNTKGNRRG